MVTIFNNIADGMGAVLAFIYKVIPSYGLAIIGLTVVVRLVLFPLTAKQARSMQKMQLVQPEIKKLQAKYKDNRQQLNEEIMKFYKENQINPMAGCLPLVFQMPVFFALYRVLREPLKHIPKDSKLFHAFCGNSSAKACHAKGLKFLGLDLSKSAADIHGVGSFTAQKHWGCSGPLIIDARIKPHHAPPLEEDPAVTRRVEALAARGGPLHGLF